MADQIVPPTDELAARRKGSEPPPPRSLDSCVSDLQSHLYGIEALAVAVIRLQGDGDVDALMPIMRREIAASRAVVDSIEQIGFQLSSGGG